MRSGGPRPAFGPAPRDLVLLADPGLVGELELYVVEGDALLVIIEPAPRSRPCVHET
jgi:hypothetical protein